MNFLNMSFYNGTTRFVVTIPCLNIALKIAHVHPIIALRSLLFNLERSIQFNKWVYFRRFFKYHDEVNLEFASLRYSFRGIYANRREYAFFKRTKNPLLWPTSFSFLGLVNIQPLATGYPDSKEDGLWHFIRKVSEENAYDDPHAFRAPSNYAVDPSGFLRLLDYWGAKQRKVILKYGRELYMQSRGLF